jgi:hypothetical protein
MNTSTDRQLFRTTLAQVAEKAKAILPRDVNGRLEGAVKLVLLDEVQPQDDGSVLVGSCTDPLKVYRLVGTTCDCKDFTDKKAPESWCRHRIAAGLHKRVRELLAASAVTSPPAPTLPEAPASVNCHLTIEGRQVQITLRDTNETRLLTRLQAVLKQYPVPAPAPPLSPQQHNAAAMHKKVIDFCPIHNVQMKENEKGGRRWYSHYDEAAGRWCKGK